MRGRFFIPFLFFKKEKMKQQGCLGIYSEGGKVGAFEPKLYNIKIKEDEKNEKIWRKI